MIVAFTDKKVFSHFTLLKWLNGSQDINHIDNSLKMVLPEIKILDCTVTLHTFITWPITS